MMTMTGGQGDPTDQEAAVQDAQDPEADHQREKAGNLTADHAAGASLLKESVEMGERKKEEPEADQRPEVQMMTDQIEKKENNLLENKYFVFQGWGGNFFFFHF